MIRAPSSVGDLFPLVACCGAFLSKGVLTVSVLQRFSVLLTASLSSLFIAWENAPLSRSGPAVEGILLRLCKEEPFSGDSIQKRTCFLGAEMHSFYSNLYVAVLHSFRRWLCQGMTQYNSY